MNPVAGARMYRRSAADRRSRAAGTALLGLLLVLLISACGRQREPVFHDEYLAFGTLIDLTLYGVDPARAAQVSDEIDRQFQRWHHDWHAWEPGKLTRLNAALDTLQPVTVDADLRPLLLEANRLARLSDNLYDPVIGKLLALWGFQGDPLPPGTTPDPAAIAAWLAQAPTVEDIRVNGDRFQSRNAGVAYDLGGFAKGYALDRVVEMLRARGIGNAIINAGGNLKAIGAHGARPWHIGIRSPRGSGLLASIDTNGDTSVLTSGDYERLFEVNGKRYPHILDPRTGYPATGTEAVTVVHENAGLADAASTALFVAGPERWLEIARRMGIDRALLVDSHGVIHMTPAMRAIIHMDPAVHAQIRVEGPD
jgi:thiamine biosynthesis lipoprotein